MIEIGDGERSLILIFFLTVSGFFSHYSQKIVNLFAYMALTDLTRGDLAFHSKEICFCPLFDLCGA